MAQRGAASFYDEVVEETRRRPGQGPRCRIEHILKAMGDEAEGLERALADRAGVKSPAIVRALRARGFDVAKWTVDYHRRGDCRCD